MTPPLVSIVIVSYDRWTQLRDTIHSLREVVLQPSVEIIVVDNASKEITLEKLRSEFPGVKTIGLSQNLGFASACNVGARVALGQYLLFSNNDIQLLGNPLPAMVKALQSNWRVGAVGCQLHNPDGTKQPSYFRFPGIGLRVLQISGLKSILLRFIPMMRYDRIASPGSGFVTGAFFMMPRDYFFELNGFDERYFMYLEDADLGYRIHLSGRISLILPSREVVHLGRNYEELTVPFTFYQTSSGYLRFYRKFHGRWKLSLLIVLSLFFYSIRFAVCRDGVARQTLRQVLRLYWREARERFYGMQQELA